MAQVKGTTLVETIIAMVIISIVFGVGLMTVESTLNSTKAPLRLRATVLLKNVAIQTINEQSFIDEIIIDNNITIRKTIATYESFENVHRLTLEAFDPISRKEIAIHHQIVRER